MNDDIAQKVQDIYETLPKDIRDVLSSEEVGKKLDAISKKHTLHIDQAAMLSDLTTMIMLGVISPNEFVSDIQTGVRISSLEATAIADDINEQILRDIKSSLEKLYADNALEEEPEDYSALKAKDILHEIENPIKAAPAAYIPPVAKAAAAPTSTVIVPKVVKPQPVQPLVEGTGENLLPAHPEPNLLEQKLSQTVRTPEPQKIEITPVPKPVSKLPPLTPKPLQNRGPDSYREPIT